MWNIPGAEQAFRTSDGLSGGNKQKQLYAQPLIYGLSGTYLAD